MDSSMLELDMLKNPLSGLDNQQLERIALQIFKDLYDKCKFIRDCNQKADKYYELKHWDYIKTQEGMENAPKPVAPVLFSTIDAMQSDLVDAMPTVTVIGEASQNKDIAEDLSDTIKYILKRRGFAKIFTQLALDLPLYGMGVSKTWYNAAIRGGGDCDIDRISSSLFLFDTEASVLNDSYAVIEFWFENEDVARMQYSKWDGTTKNPHASYSEVFNPDFEKGETREGKKDTCCFDLFWREAIRGQEDGSADWNVYSLRMVGGSLVTKNVEKTIYENGEYPFDVITLYPMPDRIWGRGLVDNFGQTQLDIDTIDQAAMVNTILAAKLRMLYNRNAGIDETALMDYNAQFISGDRIGEDAVRWQQTPPLPAHTFMYKQSKIASIKDESGQNQFNRGEGGRSVSAASAIIALQEAGNKRVRKIIKGCIHPWIESVAKKLIDMIAQYYQQERYILITGEDGKGMSKPMSAESLKAGRENIDYMLQINPEKDVPYISAYFNELIGMLIQSGSLPYQLGLKLMHMDRKEEIINTLETYEGDKINELMQIIEKLAAKLEEQDAILGELEKQVPISRQRLNVAGNAPQSGNAGGLSNINNSAG